MKKQPRNRPFCDYSFFLFSNLYNVSFKPTKEYDLLFEDVCKEFNRYCDSKYNDEKKPEYECMVEYLFIRNIELS